jgi:hypothetical protein
METIRVLTRGSNLGCVVVVERRRLGARRRSEVEILFSPNEAGRVKPGPRK